MNRRRFFGMAALAPVAATQPRNVFASGGYTGPGRHLVLGEAVAPLVPRAVRVEPLEIKIDNGLVRKALDEALAEIALDIRRLTLESGDQTFIDGDGI